MAHVRPSVNGRRRVVLAALALVVIAASCSPGFDPASKVNTLRIISVTADKPYALPGEDVTLSMTLYDGLARVNDNDTRPIQVLWLGGCFDPEGDQFYLCFQQLAETLAPLAGMGPGGAPPDLGELVELDYVASGSDGEPDAASFSFRLPDDILSQRAPPTAGPHYGIAYVFFAACAGQLAPGPLTAPGGGEVPDFPLECHDISGDKLGSESFVIGYTQVYAFADQRPNANPPIVDLTIDGATIGATPQEAAVVAPCPIAESERRQAACARSGPTDDCTKYALNAVVDDIAEVDPEAVDADGNILREVLWVSYFTDGGDLDPSLMLVSDAVTGYQEDHDTEWTPPAEPGLFSIWAVLRDQRGGQSVVRRYVRVE